MFRRIPLIAVSLAGLALATGSVAGSAAGPSVEPRECVIAIHCPDLRIARTSPNSVTVRNASIVRAASSGPFWVHVTAGRWDKGPCEEVVAEQRIRVRGLAAGASRTLTIPVSVTPRAVHVDAHNERRERNEWNNLGVVPRGFQEC